MFYKAPEDQRASDHADMQKCLQPAVTRFDAIEQDEAREQFRDKLSGYVGLYAYLSQIVPYGDPEQEMLYSYGHFLLPHLPLDRDDEVIKLGSEVALQYYRLERVSSGPINVSEGEPQHVRPPTEVGTGRAQDPKAPLSEIIEVLNERFGTQFNEVDRLFFQQIKEKACNDETVVETARANPRDRFELGIKNRLDELMIERMSENDQIAERYLSDENVSEFGPAHPRAGHIRGLTDERCGCAHAGIIKVSCSASRLNEGDSLYQSVNLSQNCIRRRPVGNTFPHVFPFDIAPR